jgi:aryl-alcohol dehydrogenase-like predicted oxidoreductase
LKLRNLGSSGLQVSLLGLGCNNFGGRTDLPTTRAVIHRALDLGINLLDTADVYSNGVSEEFIGQVLGGRRKDVVLATKFGGTMGGPPETAAGASRRYIVSAVEASLGRLKTDWVDLYQLHWPDPRTPIEETLRALDDLVSQGKVRYIGCSNLPAWRVVDAQWTSKQLGLHAFVSSQNEYNLLNRAVERELLPAVQACGLGFVPYFPLASGLLTGKYRRNAPMPQGARLSSGQGLAKRFLTEANWSTVEALAQLCEARGHGLLELALGWLAAQPSVCSIITGATRPEQLEANARALEWSPSHDELAEVDRLTKAS